jgi:hypothetical protein
MGSAVFSFTRAEDRPAGGCSPYRDLSLGVAGQVVKGAPGRLYGWDVYNGGAAPAYLKLYDQVAAPDATKTPVLTIAIPAGASGRLEAPAGISFAHGIACRASTGVADDDATAPTANQVVANLFFA